jgi:E3 ubiquitin-protein ligase MARCH3
MCIKIDGMDYICRICHGGNSSGDLLTPCRCKGTIALAHLNCLEIWLNESNRNECELCKYHFRIVREPK